MNEDGLFIWDWNYKKGDIEVVNGLETACLVSLFTDSRLQPSVVYTPIKRGGWIGNIRTAKEPRQLGSTLWSLEHAKVTTYFLTLRKEACNRAFDWMLKDGITTSIYATSNYDNSSISDTINIVSKDGSKYEAVYLWRKTIAFKNSSNINTRG
jgi:phage gp46-like protein